MKVEWQAVRVADQPWAAIGGGQQRVGAFGLLGHGAGERLRACGRAGCGVVFVDTSRNGRRRFCSVRCANQVNVANHRLRQRQAAVVR